MKDRRFAIGENTRGQALPNGNRIIDAHNLEGLVGDDLRDVAPSLSRSAVYIELIENVSEIYTFLNQID